jgi:23S rRNA (uracil1939-C5)-methyltransferase
LAHSFEQVVAVESAGPSARDLRLNLSGKPHRVVASSTLDFLKAQPADRQKPDLVIVDPPRAGLGKDVTTLLSRFAAPQLAYVSCDPATLARDVQWLLQSGYHLENITLLDLFPQTYHLETVVTLSRS